MNKKTFRAAVTIFAILFSLVGTEIVEVAKANFVPYGTLTIISPANQTYNSNFLTLNFTAAFSVTTNKTVTYSIDEQPQVIIAGLQYSGDVLLETANGIVSLPYLSNGTHFLQMYAKTQSSTILPETGYASVYFTINSTTPPPSATASPTPAKPDPSQTSTAIPAANPSPSPTPTPTAMPSPYLSPEESEQPSTSPSPVQPFLNDTAIVVIVTVAVVLVSAIAVLLVLSRRKR